MTTVPQTTRHRTVPIPGTLTKIGRGYPDKLVIFRLAASKFWWVRYFSLGKIIKKSTRTTHKNEAIAFAKTFYEDILLRERNLLPISQSPSFELCARELFAEQANLIARGERNAKLNLNDEAKFNADLLPHFRNFDVRNITYKHIEAYVAKIAARGLKPATLKTHLVLIHKILAYAQRERLIESIPAMPKIKMQESTRGWFDQSEYNLLRKTAAKAAKEQVTVRYHRITDELRLLITFMTNTFIRPSDLKNLRHRNVQIVENGNIYLRISPESSKTVKTPIVSMEDAVGIYKDLLAHHKKMRASANAEDFVFFPALKNRDFALQTIRRQFDQLLELAELKKSPSGEARTLYSLRHTAIMFRLTKGDNIDLLTLARNCRTSVEMIERFYARPLSAEMNIEKIQSKRVSKKKGR
jgi:site-specific recombinase XerD